MYRQSKLHDTFTSGVLLSIIIHDAKSTGAQVPAIQRGHLCSQRHPDHLAIATTQRVLSLDSRSLTPEQQRFSAMDVPALYNQSWFQSHAQRQQAATLVVLNVALTYGNALGHAVSAMTGANLGVNAHNLSPAVTHPVSHRGDVRVSVTHKTFLPLPTVLILETSQDHDTVRQAFYLDCKICSLGLQTEWTRDKTAHTNLHSFLLLFFSKPTLHRQGAL